MNKKGGQEGSSGFYSPGTGGQRGGRRAGAARHGHKHGLLLGNTEAFIEPHVLPSREVE